MNLTYQQQFILGLRGGRHVLGHPTLFFRPLRPGRPDAIFKHQLHSDVRSNLNDVALHSHTCYSSPTAHLTP